MHAAPDPADRPIDSNIVTGLAAVLARSDADQADVVPASAVPTGFPSLDQVLGGGLRAGDLVALTGDTASGKSALALAIALRAAAAGHVVAHFTSEHPPQRVLERALALEARISIDQLRQGALDASQREAAGLAALALRDRAPLIESLPAGGFSPVADALRRALDLELAIVDPLEGIPGGAAPLEEELAAAARQLKALAVELQAAILVTAAPRMPLAGRSDPRPTLDDLPGLGALKQHADVVLGLFREEMYQEDRGIEGATELRVLKNRNGGVGYVDLYFYKQWLRFEDMVEPER